MTIRSLLISSCVLLGILLFHFSTGGDCRGQTEKRNRSNETAGKNREGKAGEKYGYDGGGRHEKTVAIAKQA